MKNADLPASPNPVEVLYDTINNDSAGYGKASIGLTKREMFAMHAMQGILSNSGGVIQANPMSGTGWCDFDAQGLAEWSLECADALLAQLEKQP